MLKIVLDTNVIISAFISPGGTCAEIIRRMLGFNFVLYYTQAMIDEYNQAMRYSKLAKIRFYSPEEIDEFLQYVLNFSVAVEEKTSVAIIRDDPDDNKILACAIDAEADYIVSGDHHLLELEKYKGIPIIKPSEFLEIIRRQD